MRSSFPAKQAREAEIAKTVTQVAGTAEPMRLPEGFEALAKLPGVVIYQRLVTPDGDIRYTYISEGAHELFGVFWPSR